MGNLCNGGNSKGCCEVEAGGDDVIKPDEHNEEMKATLTHLGVAFVPDDHPQDSVLSQMKATASMLATKSDDDEIFQKQPQRRHLKSSAKLIIMANRVQSHENLPDAKESNPTPRLNVAKTVSLTSDTGETIIRPNFSGIWKCTSTWGLEEFLKKCGVGMIQRIAAVKAPWPWWVFEAESNDLSAIHFTNHGPLGDVDEHIDLSGKDYYSLDGKKQKLINKAYWQGECLIIERTAPQGKYRELRLIDESHHLQFTLEQIDGAQKGAKWGRVFERGDEHFHNSK